MAYYLKYFHDIERDGISYRLGIYIRDTYPGLAKRICNLTECTVGYVGSNNPDDPITKTEMRIALVDAPDRDYGENEKGGDWTEFYTQDPTLYKVELSEVDQSIVTTRWTGYITPDSWTEDLRYNGTVGIIARDNIGHLKDFDFTHDEPFLSFDTILQTCRELSGQDIQVGESAWGLEAWYDSEGTTGGTELSNLMLNKDVFDGKTWYDVLEAFLLAFGFVLRWFDYNIFGIVPIGWLKTEDFAGDLVRQNKVAEFINESGRHSLNPMCKQIKETISYDYYSPERDVLRRDFIPATLGSPITSGEGYAGHDITKSDDAIGLRFALTRGEAGYYADKEFLMPSNTDFKIGFSIMGGFYFKNLPYGVIPASLSYFAKSVTVHFSLIWESLNLVDRLYLDKTSGWVTSERIITASSESSVDGELTQFSISRKTPTTLGHLILRLYSAECTSVSSSSDRYFGLINGLTIDYDIASKTQSHTTTTINNAKANIKLDRKDEVGQFVGDPGVAMCVKNAIFASGLPLAGLSYNTDISPRFKTTFEFIHRNLLCCYLDTTSVLEGEFRDKTEDRPHFSDVWLYPFKNGYKKFILTGGRLNVVTGLIESAVLRQVADFEELYPKYRLGGYTIEVLGYDANDDQSYADLTDPMNIGLFFQDIDNSVITLHCRIATPEATWAKPLLEARTSQDGVIYKTIHLLDYDASDKSGSWAFDVDLIPEDVDGQYNTLEIGPAAMKVYDEQGYSYEDLPTYDDLREIRMI